MIKTSLLAAILLAASGTTAAAQQQFPNWEVSFSPGGRDAAGNVLGGTEIRDIVAFGSPIKLYAGVNYWMDQEPHGDAQVLVKDSPSAPWRQEVAFPNALATGILSSLNFKKDRSGNAVNVWVLVAGTWPVGLPKPMPIRAFVRNNSDGQWYETVVAHSDNGQIRAFGTHMDTVTGEAMAFAHAGDIGVFHGWLADKRGAGKAIIEWADGPEWIGGQDNQCSGAGERIMGFAEAEGALYATKCFTVIKRTDGPQANCQSDEVKVQNACEKRWKEFYKAPGNPSSESGYRGMTTVTASGQQWLLIGWEGGGAVITRLDPLTGTATTELDVNTTLNNAWGMPTNYIITSYSPPMPLWFGADGRGRRIIGFEAFITKDQAAPSPGHSLNLTETAKLDGGGWYFLRDAAFSYRMFRVPYVTGKPMVAVRAAAASPWPEECNAQGQDCAIYFGGFDANKSTVQTPCFAPPCNLAPQPTHGTGWIVKGFN